MGSSDLTMVVVRELPWEEIKRLHDPPPTAIFVPLLHSYVGTGERMEFQEPIMHHNKTFMFGRIVASASVDTFKVQLLCRANQVRGVGPIAIPVDKTYLVYPPELIVTNLVADVPVVSIAGEILVFSVSSPTSADFYVLKLLPLPHPSYHC
jgi:hypothetical protein